MNLKSYAQKNKTKKKPLYDFYFKNHRSALWEISRGESADLPVRMFGVSAR